MLVVVAQKMKFIRILDLEIEDINMEPVALLLVLFGMVVSVFRHKNYQPQFWG
jgi:hypothetical protein